MGDSKMTELIMPPHDPNLEGVWGRIVSRYPVPNALSQALVKELNESLDLLSRLPPAATFFGGARIDRDDPYYQVAEKMGAILAEREIPPRTGAGPGIMSAIPEGFKKKLIELGRIEEAKDRVKTTPCSDTCEPTTWRARTLTQGFNIQLPFEQSVNPAIDISLELTHFPTRKMALWKNALGLIVFPGGFGTLDELLEVWRHKQRGRISFPLVCIGKDYWNELREGLRLAGETNKKIAISNEDMRLLYLTDEPEKALSRIVYTHPEESVTESLKTVGKRMAYELVEALFYLESLQPAVTFLGGSLLEETDKEIQISESMAEMLAEQGVPTRAGGPGALSIALHRGGHKGAETLPQQAFGIRRGLLPNFFCAERVHIVEDRLTHKVLLTENARAFVALPGGIGTLDEVFSIICQLQTQKIPHRRVILIGSSFWNPIFESIRSQMLNGPRKTISPRDLELVTITDDPAEAAELCLKPPKKPLTKTSRD